ncbi:hypothetical protein VB780_09105 [Leptolyngbya sp. CCNP1308]|uniref:hypothetical protein n=1 Tax=Leptolyngbya sp. CCNP1308 TaxID=3110255 RepID=UPI002B20613C|nr:hypothetical protein [Leptolyngbya sp. CCNP1308]MEA5448722.1 hypothetical protein [Leptolyngbya sp. CCNP1308]
MFAKTFRNTLIASSLLVGASLLAGPAALAATDNGEATGTVQAVNTIDFTPATGTAITGGAAELAYPMGTLALQDNATAGWTLEVSSLNGGKLLHTVTPANVIAYTQLTTDDLGASTATPVDFVAAATNYELHDSLFDAVVAEGVTGIAVTAEIAAGQWVPVGTYADTLTFTLTSK